MRSIACASVAIAALICWAPAVKAAPAVPEPGPGISRIVPVQGWRERCRYLRHRLRELEERRAYAPPWEVRRLDRRIWETREELRNMRCW
ncbi:MAG TPA: hypothetical protein VFA12_19075 [Stellaceae bacterium]|jgi:hypothetical protein|nr:hypothetical protein [Stellaceae bacterium]